MSGKTGGCFRGLIIAGAWLLLTGCRHVPVPEVAETVHQGMPGSLSMPASDVAVQLEAIVARLEALEHRLPVAPASPAENLWPGSVRGREIEVSDLPALGSVAARLGIIEVTDYQCPYCRAHYRETFGDLRQRFIETGIVRYHIFHYPLPGHLLGQVAAAAGTCAAEEGVFWPVHQALFELDQLLDADQIVAVTNAQIAEPSDFNACLNESQGKFQEYRLSSTGGQPEIRGTPPFFIGRLRGDTLVAPIITLSGVQSVAAFQHAIDRFQRAVE